jgi:hypothetical protein
MTRRRRLTEVCGVASPVWTAATGTVPCEELERLRSGGR